MNNTVIEINPQFKRALELMEDNTQGLFITGKAGTGKSTLLDYFREHTDKKTVILAPTGVAALNVKGQTIHRFFNFYIDVTPEKIKSKDTKPRDPKLYKNLRTIIIDEVSMLRADLLDCIDVFLRLYGPDSEEAFGGVQMVFVGDLHQLPPVVPMQERDIFRTHYATPYFFSAHVFESVKIETIELDKVYRQKEQPFIDLLNRIRNNCINTNEMAHLNSRYLPSFKLNENEFYISLTTTNKKADQINDTYLQSLEGEFYHSNAIIKGDFGREYYPTATVLQFKIGSQIMLLNNDQKKRWVNGSIGVIEKIKEDEDGEEYVRVRLQDNDKVVSVSRYTWEVYRFTLEGKNIISAPVGTFAQFPFRLAWAVTIHKSQGKTFDRVIIDIDRGTFVPGQLYVGLSRCTSFEGVVLNTPIKRHHIQTDPRIIKFLATTRQVEDIPF
jgi:ATP-dependent DNA helicase PIF1